MGKAFVLTGALLLAWGLPGWAAEADSGDAVVKDMIGFLKEGTTVLQTIKDKDSAEAAKPKLEALGKKGRAIPERLRKLNLTRDQMMDLRKKYKDQMDAAQKAFSEEVQRVKKVEGGQVALNVLMGVKAAPKDGPKEKKATDK